MDRVGCPSELDVLGRLEKAVNPVEVERFG